MDQAAPNPAAASHLNRLRAGYLDLVRNGVLGLLHDDPAIDPGGAPRAFDAGLRREGLDWPASAQSMIGELRMRNLQRLAERTIIEQVPGDFIETGVWRGGACIMMRAVLEAYGDTTRRVWVADSFEGLPPPSPEAFPRDAGDTHHQMKPLAVPLGEVQRNFERYGLLDAQVQFLKGWFRDTLASAPTGPLALMRLDGDMYESTIQALEALFPRLSPGGFVIIDDYGYIESCRAAVDEYRERMGITDPLLPIDSLGVYWRNAAPHALRPEPAPPAPRSARVVVLREELDALAGHHLEQPVDGERFGAHSMPVAGWVVGRQAQALSITVTAAGRALTHAPVDILRPDVQRVHPGRGPAAFRTVLPLAELPRPAELDVNVRLDDGGLHRIATVRLD